MAFLDLWGAFSIGMIVAAFVFATYLSYGESCSVGSTYHSFVVVRLILRTSSTRYLSAEET
jgi:hypothetical protein